MTKTCAATEQFPTNLNRDLTTQELQSYHDDGAVVLRNVVPMVWIEHMRKAIQLILDNPGDASMEYTPKNSKGRYYGDFFIWLRNNDFRAFIQNSALPEIAAKVFGSERVQFFYDQLLVKEPGTREETPWHQDLPYWPVRGQDILSLWVPFDHANKQSGVVHYLKGSHKWGKKYAPSAFSKDSGFDETYAKMGLEPLPDMEALIKKHEVMCWDVEPGDIILHHPLTLHYAPGNSSKTGRRRGLALRYLGDDAVYDDRPGTFMENPKIQAILPKFSVSDGDKLPESLFPTVWPR